MSQYPPPGNPQGQNPYGNPPGSLPPGYGAPGYGAPGIGQPGQGYSLQPAMRTSAAAITSLIFGILGCVPFVTSVVAIITAFIGLSATKSPTVKGRGMAVAGMILGILGILGWGGISISAFVAWEKTGPERTMSRQFITDVGSGNLASASANCSMNLSPLELQNDNDQFTKWGGTQNIRVIGVATNYANSKSTEEVTALTTFQNGQAHVVKLELVNENGTWKVDSMTVQ